MKYFIRISGEISLKSAPVRRRFLSQLSINIRDALTKAGIKHTLQNNVARYFLTAEQDPIPVLKKVFGICSISVVERSCSSELAEIVQVGEEFYRDKVVGKSFAIKARRTAVVGFKSTDVNEQLGARLAADPTNRVDLSNPEELIELDIQASETLFFRGRIRGPGGMPVGSSGQVICLLSGGFDSAVAAQLLMKRGIRPIFLYVNFGPKSLEGQVIKIAKKVGLDWAHGFEPRLVIVDFQPFIDHMRATCSAKYFQVLLKRAMYRLAEGLAHQNRASAICTGESIAQVSSQTLENLRAIESAVDIPVLRPLISFDKDEIIELNRRLEIWDLCAHNVENCQLTGVKPVTACRENRARHQEEQMDLAIIDRLLENRREYLLKSVSEVLDECLFVSKAPEGAIVIDCRSDMEQRRSPLPEGRRLPFDGSFEKYLKYHKSQPLVFFCSQGVQSAIIAEYMQGRGYQAFCLRA